MGAESRWKLEIWGLRGSSHTQGQSITIRAGRAIEMTKAKKKTSTGKPRRRFRVILLIMHPTIDPKVITRELSLSPYASSHKGHPTTTPGGQVLPYPADATRWNHIFRFNGTKKRLATSVERIVDSMTLHKRFFRKLCRQGGNTQLYVQLPGDVNNGATFPWHLLMKMSDIRIGLGIEVFPKSPDLM